MLKHTDYWWANWGTLGSHLRSISLLQERHCACCSEPAFPVSAAKAWTDFSYTLLVPISSLKLKVDETFYTWTIVNLISLSFFKLEWGQHLILFNYYREERSYCIQYTFALNDLIEDIFSTWMKPSSNRLDGRKVALLGTWG